MRFPAMRQVAAASFFAALLVLNGAATAHAVKVCETRCAEYYEGRCVRYEEICTEQAPTRSYGAIAYSRSSGAHGYSHGFGDRAYAEKAALKYCAQNAGDCEVIVWFYDTCAAVAADGDSVGWGIDPDRKRAGQTAMDQCIKAGGKKCRPIVSHCSR